MGILSFLVELIKSTIATSCVSTQVAYLDTPRHMFMRKSTYDGLQLNWFWVFCRCSYESKIFQDLSVQ